MYRGKNGPCAILVFYSEDDILVVGEVFDQEVFECLSRGVQDISRPERVLSNQILGAMWSVECGVSS